MIRIIILLISLLLSSNIYAISYRYYAQINGIYNFKNICAHAITITPATLAEEEKIELGDALNPEPKISTSQTISGSFGMEWDFGYRTEINIMHIPQINYSHQTNEASDITQFKYSLTSIMGNLVFMFPESNFIIPFVNIGAGYSKNHLYNFEIYDSAAKKLETMNDASFWKLAWQVGAGATLRLNNYLDLDIGYKYISSDRLDSGKEKTITATKSSEEVAAKSFGMLYSHNAFLGIRIYF